MARADIAQPTPRGGLTELLWVLSERTGIDVSAERVEQAVSDTTPAAPWATRLEEAAGSIGLRVRWLVAPPSDAVKLARPDLPVVTRSDGGVWWLLDGKAPGLVHALPIDDPRGARWWSTGGMADRIGAGTRPWGLIEPVLPSAPLSSPDGPRSPVRRLQALLSMERQDIAVVVLYGAVAGLLSLATPLAIQVLINWLAFGALLQPVVLLGGAVLVCLTLAAGLRLLQRIAVETVERRIFVRTVADLTSRLSRVRAEAFDGVWGPELANRFFDVLTLQKAAGTLLLDGVTAVLQVAVAVAILAVYHPWLLLFDFFLLGGMALSLIPLGRGAEATAIKESKAKYAMASWIEEVARHPVALRQDGSRLAETRADHLARAWLGTRDAHFRIFLRQFTGVQALQVIASAVLLVASGALVLDGELTIGQLVAAEFIVTAALAGFAKFADKLDTIYDLLAGVDKLGTLLDLPPEDPVGLPDRGEGPVRVQLDGAVLAYSTGLGTTPTLDLVLEPGSLTTVFGPPGSGKSSLAALVAGARAPTAGVVLRDGVDLRRLRPEARYEGVMLIRPGDVLIGSVRDNVSLMRAGVGDPEVWTALEAVGLRRRIEGLSGGLDTQLDPTGAPLPEGELRALLVARALVARPRLVVVDSVLDGMPADDRRRLLAALCSRSHCWTLLVLTGDPDAVDGSTRVLTLGPGGLDERSTLAPA